MTVREQRRLDDAQSRPFGGATARDIIAESLASFDGWGEIRPTHWAAAGRAVRDLRAAGIPLRRQLDGAR